MLCLNYDKDYTHAIRLFGNAFDIAMELVSKQDIRYLGESVNLVWRMKYHEGIAWLYDGKLLEALEIFQFICTLTDKDIKSKFFCIAIPQDVLDNSAKRITEIESTLASRRNANILNRKFIDILLPPGSRRRSIARKVKAIFKA
jgi:hypothetical protein